jgi:pimeloyl-ACP methyl ester carboxylesterase/ubiquinone/menaquinone biosynthesis C-methylase UbiE
MLKTNEKAVTSRDQLLAEAPVTERRLELTGVSTSVLEAGAGAPLLLLHGPGANATHWLWVLPQLAATHHVIAPDLPGLGSSELSNGPLDAAGVIDWIDELIDRTCPTPPVLVAYAFAGAMAARFAAERSDRLKALVLVDMLGLVPFAPAPDFSVALNDFLAEPSTDTHDRLWRQCALDLEGLRERMGGRWEPFESYNVDNARDPSVMAALGALMEQFGVPAVPPAVLERITVPTTLIWGRHDLATPVAVAEQASARYGWPLHVIEDCADGPPIERPEAFIEALRSGLSGPAQRTQAAWDKIAAGYDEFVTPTHMWLGSEGLSRAGLGPAMRFLDVAAGSGALSIPAARLGAKVLSTDLSSAMLQRLGERAREEGLAQLETRVMDGHELELEDDSFDVAGSQFGVMLFPDMPRGVGELARVTKPGGRVLMTVYGPPHEVEFFDFFVRAIQAAVPGFTGPPTDPPPLPFQLQDPETLRDELARAGLSDVRVETITESLEFHSGEQLWDWLVNSNPIAGAILGELGLTSGQTAVVRQALEDMVSERSGGSGPAVLTNPVNIGLGTKR